MPVDFVNVKPSRFAESHRDRLRRKTQEDAPKLLTSDNGIHWALIRSIPNLNAACTMKRLRYYEYVQQFQRITIDPEMMGGKPCIRGMRVTVGMVVEALSAGRTIEQLLVDFPYLEEQDIREALAFAASLAQGHDVRIAS